MGWFIVFALGASAFLAVACLGIWELMTYTYRRFKMRRNIGLINKQRK